MDYTDLIDPPNSAPEGEIAHAPDPAGPLAAPEPEQHFYSYTLDVADTALAWSYGAPLDVTAIRQYLVDRGHAATTVEAGIDATGRPTGRVTVRTDPVPPSLEVNLADPHEQDTIDGASPATAIPDTAIVQVPDGYTYAGSVTFAAELYRDAGEADLRLVPVVNGAALPAVTGPWQDIGWTGIVATVDVTGLPGGTIPTFGLAFGGSGSGDTLRIRDATILGTLTSAGSAFSPIAPADWAQYDGSRWAGIAQTIVTWANTAEGAVTPKPDLARIAGFWLYLENNGVEISQVAGLWNFATPATAPAVPTLEVYAWGAIDPALIGAYLYAEIDAVALNAFTVDWNASTATSTMRRTAAGEVSAPGQDDRSAPVLWYQETEPSGDVRENDIWSWTGTYRRYSAGSWVDVTGRYGFTNENSTATGRRAVAGFVSTTATGVDAKATDRRATATGAGAEALGDSSTATGGDAGAPGNSGTATGVDSRATGIRSTATGMSARAYGTGSVATGVAASANATGSIAHGAGASVSSSSPRSMAEGDAAQVPSSTPDTKVSRFNDVRQVPSDGAGRTRYGLQSPNGTLRYISIGNDGAVFVDDVGLFPGKYRKSFIHNLGYVSTGSTTSPASVVALNTPTGDDRWDFGPGLWDIEAVLSGAHWRSVDDGGVRLIIQMDGVAMSGAHDIYMGWVGPRNQKLAFPEKKGKAFGVTGKHTFRVLFGGAGTPGDTILNECAFEVIGRRVG